MDGLERFPKLGVTGGWLVFFFVKQFDVGQFQRLFGPGRPLGWHQPDGPHEASRRPSMKWTTEIQHREDQSLWHAASRTRPVNATVMSEASGVALRLNRVVTSGSGWHRVGQVRLLRARMVRVEFWSFCRWPELSWMTKSGVGLDKH